eukprot:CAMPEP_0117512292 /NCGR_PEP_ID=MMETSP0784-20121206/28956_1 /TAXON_ID=39447 /ORGANISM="" /LENGTH=381 /DNA_ID=CAMNT_0005308007 /DNA_START=65 /DNA_END=1210 /DNA_ORIENTATION=-
MASGGYATEGEPDRMQPGGVGTLTMRKMDSTAIRLDVRIGDTVADLKRQAAKRLGVPWYELHWAVGGGLLDNDLVWEVGAVTEVSCVVAPAGHFPLDSGIFNHLVVTGVTGEPIFGEPDGANSGRLCVSGEIEAWEGEKYSMPDGSAAVVIAENRKLIVIGDADVEQDDAYISAGWSETVRLQPDSLPVLLGWRVRYVADRICWNDDPIAGIASSGPTFGLTTRENLTENMSTGRAAGVITFAPRRCGSVVFSQRVSSRSTVEVKGECESSSFCAGGSQIQPLPANAAGGFDYDVLIVFDSDTHEVRASVGWGTAGSRIDKVVVSPLEWPPPDLPLVPFVSLVCEDFSGFNNVCEGDQLPISFESLTKGQMADDAIQALLL